jgi:hypothetical protein
VRQAINGWLVIAGCLVLLGSGAFIQTQMPHYVVVPAGMIKEWRHYATEVEQGKRTPSAKTTRMLTETAIGQNEYATSSVQLLRLVSASAALLGLVLMIDLARYRARHTSPRSGHTRAE